MSSNFKQRVIIDYNKKKIKQNLLIILKNFIKRRAQKLKISKIIIVKSIIESLKKQSTISNKFLDNETKFEMLFKKLRKFQTSIDFELVSNNLIYYIDIEYRRLCISKIMKKKVFKLIHDDNIYTNIYKYYNQLIKTLFISRLSRKIRRYIKHYFNYQLTQIKRHRLYDKLMFIVSSSYFFHIIIMNFVLTLSNNLNVVLIVIDKFFRRIIFIIDKFIYNVNQ